MTKKKAKYLKKGEEILQISAEIFRKKGYHKATMRDIGDAVSMLSGSLYYYYPSKENLLYNICKSSIEQLLADIKYINGLNLKPDEKMKRIIKEHLMHIFNHMDYLSVFISEMRFLPEEYKEDVSQKRDEYDQIIQSLIDKGNDENIFHVEDTKLATLSILGMINWTTQWYKPSGRLSQEQIIKKMTSFIFKGILNYRYCE